MYIVYQVESMLVHLLNRNVGMFLFYVCNTNVISSNPAKSYILKLSDLVCLFVC